MDAKELLKKLPPNSTEGMIHQKGDYFFVHNRPNSILKDKNLWKDNPIKCSAVFNANGELIARNVDKFFYIDFPLNKYNRTFEFLESFSDIQYPVSIEVKHNGFLAMVGYNSISGTLEVFTKNAHNTKFTNLASHLIANSVSMYTLEGLCADENVSVCFEVADRKEDPHIIDYKYSSVFPLYALYNDINKEIEYNYNLNNLLHGYGVDHEIISIVNSQRELYKFLETKLASSNKIEGYILKDATGKRYKVKTDYYNIVKKIRTILFDTIDPQKRLRYLDSMMNSDNEFERFISRAASKDVGVSPQIISDIYGNIISYINYLSQRGGEI